MAPVLFQPVQCSCGTGTTIQLGRLASFPAQAAAVKLARPGFRSTWFCQGVAKRLSNPRRMVSLPFQGLLKMCFSQSEIGRIRPSRSLSSSSKAGGFVTREGGAIKVDFLISTERQARRIWDDGGKAQSEPLSASTPNGPSKTCQQCFRTKPVNDFKRTVGSPDGRLEFCRACMAVFHAERLKKELHHLGLSVEEAWETGKPCKKCGVFKELRDFVRAPLNKDRVQNICRGCQSDKTHELPNKQPSEAPQECILCHESKPASQFALNKMTRTGLLPWCKPCAGRLKKEYVARVKEVPKHMPKMTKLCSVCRENKPRTEFSPEKILIDGLTPACKNCRNGRRKGLGKKRKGPNESL